jgi:hypothetical protein
MWILDIKGFCPNATGSQSCEVFALVVVTLAQGQHAVKLFHLGWAVHFSDVSGLCRNFNSLTNFTGKTPSRLGAVPLGVKCLHVQLKNRENEP